MNICSMHVLVPHGGKCIDKTFAICWRLSLFLTRVCSTFRPPMGTHPIFNCNDTVVALMLIYCPLNIDLYNMSLHTALQYASLTSILRI